MNIRRMPTKILFIAVVIMSIANLIKTGESFFVYRQDSQGLATVVKQVKTIHTDMQETKIVINKLIERQDRLEDMVFGDVAFDKLSETQKRNARIAWDAAKKHNVEPSFLTMLAFCESSLDDQNVNTNHDTRKTTDHGLFQINDYWHAEVDRECALSATCAADWSAKRVAEGYKREWYCSSKIAAK